MNKKEKEIRDMLNNCCVPSYDEDAPMNAIEFIHKNYSSIPKFRTSNKQFILSQIGFIRKRTWVFEILILALICSAFYNIGSESSLNFETFSLISILSPLLLIINIEEISRVYYKSMLEIEFSTKNSLKKVLATRMLILGITDCIVLIIMMLFVGNVMNISTLRVIMYTFVPFNLVCIGCMQLMKYFKGRELNYACTTYSVLLMLIFILVKINDLGIYAQNFISSWTLIYIITTIIFAIEMKKFWKRLDLFDDVIKEVTI
ncbi:membrane protein [Clostridium botulinum A2B3 87]|uniref:hypothetical protein n=1 Tax=Clostridium botulinum TaxID=1491 RepID=UPI0001F84F4A|nr:hypothetical protein [Clostridium botulinum]KEI98599.1 membrane protein [Clostridium botulinum A2B3 87]NFB15783.1 hypothetical protein [Clostridium botulinum]NFB66207.1 hypothetical protein [Clostridium botulinum]NFB97005.1 hypothetical protein [Clostridium botulinum]NFC45830.1 hypothetical protein [Clostridium botulinum]